MEEEEFWAEDDEGYDFQYDSDADINQEEEENDSKVFLANTYYSAKELKDVGLVVQALQRVVSLSDGDEWGFRALKRLVKLFLRNERWAEAERVIEQLLGSVSSGVVTALAAERGLLSLVRSVTSSRAPVDVQIRIIEHTLALETSRRNARLSFRAGISLGNLLLRLGSYDRVRKICAELRDRLKSSDGQIHRDSSTQLLEIHALEMQERTEVGDMESVVALFNAAMEIRSAVPAPHIQACILECGGKAALESEDYKQAFTRFFDAFKAFDEAGDERRVRVLKYLALTSMLSEKDVSVFCASEIQAYVHHPEVAPLVKLVECYLRDDNLAFEKTLQHNRSLIMSDRFIRHHLERLLMVARRVGLLHELRAYSRVSLGHLANRLGISIEVIHQLLSILIADGEISGKIDQANQWLLMNTLDSRHQTGAQLLALAKSLELV